MQNIRLKHKKQLIDFYKKSNDLYMITENSFAGITPDGSVVTAGYNGNGHLNLQTWHNIIKIVSNGYATFGLTNDGRVLAAGEEEKSTDGSGISNFDVHEWTDIKDIFSLGSMTIGLKHDGSVVAKGVAKYWAAENISAFTNIIQLQIVGNGLAGLKADGTVVISNAKKPQRIYETSSWSNITEIFADEFDILYGLKDDGTVLSTGYKQRTDGLYDGVGSDAGDVKKWRDIVDIIQDSCIALGLRADGTVLSTSYITEGKPKSYGLSDTMIKNHDIIRRNASTVTEAVSVKINFDSILVLKNSGDVDYLREKDDSESDDQIKRWKNVISIKFGDIFNFIGVTIDGRILQMDDCKKVYKDTASYKFDLSGFQLISRCFDAYETAASMLMDDDGETPIYLLRMLSQCNYINSSELYGRCDSVVDKSKTACVISNGINELYRGIKRKKYRYFSVSNLKNLVEIIKNYPDAYASCGDIIADIEKIQREKLEQERIKKEKKAKEAEERKCLKDKKYKEMMLADKKVRQIENEQKKCGFFEFKKKAKL